MFSDLKLNISYEMEFVRTADGFNLWWDYWKPHLFQRAVASALTAIDQEHQATPEEVHLRLAHSPIIFTALF